jgi:hypothetical protein
MAPQILLPGDEVSCWPSHSVVPTVMEGFPLLLPLLASVSYELPQVHSAHPSVFSRTVPSVQIVILIE